MPRTDPDRHRALARLSRLHVQPVGRGGWVPSPRANHGERGAGSVRSPRATAGPEPVNRVGAVDRDPAVETPDSVDAHLSAAGPPQAGRHAVFDPDEVPVDPPRRAPHPGDLALRIGLRLGVTRRQVLLVFAAAVLAVGFALVQAYLHRPQNSAVPLAAPTGGVGAATPALPTTTPGAQVVVHVVGEVVHPGLVRLTPGARVADAVRAAGGAGRKADLATVNLARPVADGEQIVVGERGAAGQPGAGGGAPDASPSALLNLNTATAEQLEALPHVGPVLAARIEQYRTDNGPFTSIEQLMDVSGIGDKTFADIAPLVSV